MTRFFSHRRDDCRGPGSNDATAGLFAYHQATKHTYRSVRTNAHYLDWDNQPDPFRRYEGSPLTVLPPEPGFPDAGTFGAMGALDARAWMAGESDLEEHRSRQPDAHWLSRLLWHSMAISAWKKVPRTGDRYSLRVNPSSGNLHPTETYLALAGFAGLGDGLYHYRADCHALELRSPGAWTQHLAEALRIPSAAESSVIVGLTSIFWREAWKYRDRAYRYCCHDLGHAMMSLLLAARALGVPAGAIAHFSDLRLSRALGLAESDEAPMAFLVFPPRNHEERSPAPPPKESFLGTPNELSKEVVPYELLLGVHCSTILPDPVDPLPLLFAANPAIADHEPPLRDAPLGPTVRRRRSALDFDPRTSPMERRDLEQLLDFATRDWLADWRGNFSGEPAAVATGADFVALYLYVHRVRDCDPGVYRWDVNGRSLEQLHRGNVERVAAFLSLEQAMAGNACFAVSMIADLATAARRFGNRGYRYVHFEAGAIGQRLYLGAEALGWNATGMGAFYDDDVHRYLGFLDEEDAAGTVENSLEAAEQSTLVMLGSPASRHAASHDRELPSSEAQSGARQAQPASRTDSSQLPRQVIYHFSVGRAVPDPRIEA